MGTEDQAVSVIGRKPGRASPLRHVPPSPPASVKFINKIQYVHSLEDLEQLIPMEHVQIPDCVLQ